MAAQKVSAARAAIFAEDQPSGPVFESKGLRDKIGSALLRRAAAGAGAGATSGAAAGSAIGAAGAGGGARTLWPMRTADAPSPTQNALHAVLMSPSIATSTSEPRANFPPPQKLRKFLR